MVCQALELRLKRLLATGAALIAFGGGCWKHELAGGDGSAGRAAPDGGAAGSDEPGPKDCGKPWYKCEATCREVIILRGGGRAIADCSR